ncbi:sulfite exporter TauE/SafE family protein [Zwartia panacis]|uniref:sulfite exporter TauE/SafE family protein n=1 Tax=Zwartia panacis TaxID=2683345 RepID=UPI0025B3ACEC|nr:sulfite exporter TauE/SafE family protein [Zwartia panacis]MDN4017710.1 sulfite exporter TauE/SafE family protein [Zwartia panacis]
MTDSYTSLALVFSIFVLAGLVKGVIGMGLPTIAIGLLGLVIAPVEAAAMLVLPSLITNIWQLISGPSFWILFKRFKTLLIGICLGTPFGVSFIVSGQTAIVTAGLGFVLMAYGLYGLSQARLNVSKRSESRASPLIGFVTGILSGATGIAALPAAPYYTALELKRDDLIQALGLSFTVASVALAIGLLVTGEFEMEIATTSLLALIPALIGMFLGQALRKRIPQEKFRRYFFFSLLFLGSYTSFRALSLIWS